MSAANHSKELKPLRILHIAFTMHARGTETWLMNVLRRIDRSRFQLDFLTINGEEGIYDKEIKELGGNLYSCPHPDNKGAFLRGLRQVLEEKGPFDAVHAHPYTMSGLALMQAMRTNIPVRIVHSHTDRRKASRDKSWVRRAYICAMKKLIKKTATYGLAASKDAAVSLFGQNWKNDPRWNVMYCGIDLKPFEKPKSKEEVRQELGISNNAKVIGHVGSFHFEKNHEFTLHLFEKMAKKNLKLHLLLVGDGPLKESVEESVRNLGLEGRVTFTGARQDVPHLLNAMDVFVFPSLFEGLGLAVVEAQAAGLTCLVADTVPKEASIVDGSVQFLPIEEASGKWKDSIKAAIEAGVGDKKNALSQVKASPFNIEHNVTMLSELYDTLSNRLEKTDAA
ncbi:MAG: glycosyltransferase family 1 protein [Alphaproteobacteria bacterium]|nr:glycosyltransferase family 1 protein [Alphaproteobacteria bacterium]